MRNDEFNKIEITNEKQIRGAEFGKTQSFEFTAQKENTLPEAEINDKFVGKTIRKTTEVNVEYANKIQAHTSATVTSSATATNAASVVSTVATAASVVAVTAVAVGTGISIALHDYEYQFNSFEVTTDSLTYELFIVDHKNERPDGEEYQIFYASEEEEVVSVDVDNDETNEEVDEEADKAKEEKPFVLHVYNEEYDYSLPADLDINIGTFTNLKPKESYHIALVENRFGGETIFDEQFTTLEEDKRVSEFNAVEFDGTCNFLTYETVVRLDFVDDLNHFSDFKFVLKPQSAATASSTELIYDLAKTTEKQTVILNSNRLFSRTQEYDYSFTYWDEGREVIAKSGVVKFKDNSGAISEVRGVEFDGTCNFLTNETTITLNYVDQLDYFSNFKFVLQSEAMTADGPSLLSYDLVKTTEPQKVRLDSNSSFFLAQTYDYSFTYDDQGTTKVIKTGTVHFEDNSGAKSEFREFIFDKTANFINRTFDVQLDFVDDFNVYDNFVLSFYMMYEQEGMTIIDERSEDIPLQKTTEVQTIDLDGVEVMLSETYRYKLTCTHYGESEVLDEGNVTFTDTSGAVDEFNEFIFDKKANFDTRTFEVQLDYTSDLGYLYSFQFILTDLETEETRTYYLDETTDVQEITVDEVDYYFDDDPGSPVYFIDIVEHRMKYTFKYVNQGEEQIVVQDEEFKFKNSLVSTFQGIDTSYDFYARTSDAPYNLPIRFLYDDAAHVYSSFSVSIFLNDVDYAYLMFEGNTVTHDWMYATLFNSFDGDYDQYNLVEADNVTIKVTATKNNPDADEEGGPDMIEEEAYVEENVNFTLNENPNIFGGRLISENIYGGDFTVGFQPIFTGEPENYQAYVIFECSTGNKYTCELEMPSMGNYSYLDLSQCEEGFNEDEFMADFDEPVKVSLKFVNIGTHPNPAQSDYVTMVIYESYSFTISV